MSHAIHPNYPGKHQEKHKVGMHLGVTLKYNFNQRYSTDSVSASILRAIAEKAGVPIQEFAVNNDVGCGTTIGPVLSSNTGVKGADIGTPQLSMHSIRETCGVLDFLYYDNLMTGFFEKYEELQNGLMGH